MKRYTGPTISQILNSYDPMRQVYRLLEKERFDLVMVRVKTPKPTITTVCYKAAFSHPDRYEAVTITSHEPVEVCPYCGHPDYLEIMR